ncbi:hypothetical protein [Roseimaritima multifibrata]|uniref:hypothetical protein n=1 Tax=Roseimaritima multifibrata TaxID=1930274 RepID=UPI0011A5EFE1|nr:hypothetical protein [Roseimaritima multifibrata]
MVNLCGFKVGTPSPAIALSSQQVFLWDIWGGSSSDRKSIVAAASRFSGGCSIAAATEDRKG